MDFERRPSEILYLRSNSIAVFRIIYILTFTNYFGNMTKKGGIYARRAFWKSSDRKDIILPCCQSEMLSLSVEKDLSDPAIQRSKSFYATGKGRDNRQESRRKDSDVPIQPPLPFS